MPMCLGLCKEARRERAGGPGDGMGESPEQDCGSIAVGQLSAHVWGSASLTGGETEARAHIPTGCTSLVPLYPPQSRVTHGRLINYHK